VNILERLLYWLRRKDLELKSDRAARERFIAEHPDYAAAVGRDDKAAQKAILTEIINVQRMRIMRQPYFRHLLRRNLMDAGATEDEIAAIMRPFQNLGRGRRY
jgi:hypothetical protein